MEDETIGNEQTVFRCHYTVTCLSVSVSLSLLPAYLLIKHGCRLKKLPCHKFGLLIHNLNISQSAYLLVFLSVSVWCLRHTSLSLLSLPLFVHPSIILPSNEYVTSIKNWNFSFPAACEVWSVQYVIESLPTVSKQKVIRQCTQQKHTVLNDSIHEVQSWKVSLSFSWISASMIRN